ncbi:MAG: hypothetical protein KME31_27820 [Tolypothrix carrinoi HA7290-LM1]|jgi:hypothetical protein|uniref:Actin-like protein N-terminal domain-containing protein n=1 Tax=Scytonema hofmannii FACHB-248 TaxID=1842502 RepID=A0ABR8GVZ6_9CYAN|nr:MULTISPECIES: hypothetical protein [Nostocales]MBD2607424.1 hypothetical protein [Scytonema hofmannii FACHB-248]MBW4571689.1 hypothetical protein [Tolypothrix carrinoi HA7290-LM1]
MTTTLTQPVITNCVKSELVKRKVLALNAGNRTTQWINPDSEPITIPSVLKEFEDWEDVPEGDTESPVIELLSEDFQVSSRYVLGVEAKIQKGKPAFAYDKIKLAKKLMFAALEPDVDKSMLVVETLRVALPDSRNTNNASILKGLEGTFNFIRNGQRLTASIRKVELMDETLPAYKYAITHRKFQRPTSKINGILDLGGGTAVGRLYSPSGQPLRKQDVIKRGTYELANLINAAMQRTQNESLDLTQIMDAIAHGTYITESGVDFSNVFEKCRDTWLDEIRAEVRVRWADYFKEIGEVLIIGGSAPLAKQLETDTKKRFRIVENFQTISIEGMIL